MTDTTPAASQSNRRALVHNAITNALSDAGDWVPLNVRIAATRAALAEVDAWHEAEPAVSSAVVAPPTDQAAAEAALAAVETALGDTLAADAREEALAGIAAVLPPTDQAAGLREADWVVEHCPEHGCVEPSTEVCHCEIADRLRRRPAAVLPEPADRAAVLRWAADRIDATRADFPIAVQNGITWATAEMRRHAADEQPGARHVHITIHHPDPTTANTAAHAIADLIHGEYSDSLRLTITTDAPGTGAAPSRPADETPDTTPQPDLQVWPLRRILTEVRCGSADWSWDEEWADLDRRHAETGYLDTLEAQIRERGITMPVLIGSDGRLWDGHHRLRIAVRAGIEYVPVEIVLPAAGARQDGAQQ
ncbi:ParB N-terminal domain-containing protein [Streptomyces sp. NPDC057115]|uniref:ParB N-terminal domain-containing protein n=1 Tax=Streptomyces sp. NPDC057115 TaxID=3346022 RepID=UPI00362CDC5F